MSGFQVEAADKFAERMYRMMKGGLNLESLDLADEVEVPAEEKEEEGDDAEEVEAEDDAEDEETKEEL